ncbi:hypothetical protein [Actinomadura hibisca]|uniref:hypothetical protein n=1 Tax=Actinomadura hibisca TaxID=68565 RepID=UPI00082AA4B6|nr:hypothetical protein [Actinomadura hibisca]
MSPFPSRDDAAAALIVRECGGDHDFPSDAGLTPTGTETDPTGETVNVRRNPCLRCGTVEVTRWRPPEPSAEAQTFIAVGTLEPPDPGDVPGVAERALRLTDQEYAAYLAECGYSGGVPADFAPDRRATATPQRLDLRVQVRAWQFALMGRHRSLGEIVPVPPYAESADLMDAVPDAVLFWAPVEDGDLHLPVQISTADPGPDPSHDRYAEISCRFATGHVALRQLGGPALDLPPLPAGHGDYRLRFHTGASGCLLQIWHQPRTRSLTTEVS